MSDVTLSASVRQSLLSLQNTTDLIERTQNRLSTGLRVSDAIDDPVAFFQAKSLSDRSADFLERKDAIDQGISTVTASLDGVEAIENLVNQLKGVSNSMKSATDAQIADLVSQFNDLRQQINNLATDATYQGTNLINGTGQTLSVEFSEQTASLLNVDSVDLTVGTAGLNINANAALSGDDSVTFSAINGTTNTADSNLFASRVLTTTQDFALAYQGTAKTFSAGETFAFTYGTGASFTFTVSTAQALTLSQGASFTVNVATSTTAATAGQVALVATGSVNAAFNYTAGATVTPTTGADVVVNLTYAGTSNRTLTSADTVTFQLGTGDVTLNITSGTTFVLTAGETFAINVLSTGGGVSQATSGLFVRLASGLGNAITAAQTGATLTNGIELSSAISANGGEISFTGLVRAGDTTSINATIDELDTALTTLRTQAQTLGSNVALLNTRLSFTEQYTNTLQGGADKLTLADINEEGANLLALQTRQQLGIQSLALAAQAEASILSLFG